MWNRIYALFVARNIEFIRDRSSLAWSLLLPILIIFVFAYAFSDDNPEKFKVGLVASPPLQGAALAFKQTRFIKFIEFEQAQKNLHKVERHQVDLLFDPNSNHYWINRTSPNGYIVEKLLIAAYAGTGEKLQQNLVEGDEVRYLDWVIPGVIAMNIMSRLWLMVAVNLVIYIGLDLFVDFRMHGSYLNLFLVFTLGCINMICCGLVVAARISSEEVANGVLNLFSWPMMFLSGIWFSLEGAHPLMQKFALILPLTHVTAAAREIMIDGAGLLEISDHLLVLGISSVVLLLIGASIFRWE